jgi:pyruvate dehydrogenase E2 component (dihydrolipoamide acetyltransferase)
VPLARIRQKAAANLHTSWVNLPHVTQHDEADITELEAYRKSVAPAATAMAAPFRKSRRVIDFAILGCLA